MGNIYILFTLSSHCCTVQPTGLLAMSVQVFLRKWVLVYLYTVSPPPESVQSGDTPSSREWVLVGVADSSQLGTAERTREFDKLQQKKTERGMTWFIQQIMMHVVLGEYWTAAILHCKFRYFGVMYFYVVISRWCGNICTEHIHMKHAGACWCQTFISVVNW